MAYSVIICNQAEIPAQTKHFNQSHQGIREINQVNIHTEVCLSPGTATARWGR
jgi:hypothetical protein